MFTINEHSSLKICFEKTRSKKYEQMLKTAKEFPNYQEISIEGKTVHQVVVKVAEAKKYLDQIMKLLEVISGLESFKVYLDNKQIEAPSFALTLLCYNKRCLSTNPDDYCFERGAEVKQGCNVYGFTRIKGNKYGCRNCEPFNVLSNEEIDELRTLPDNTPFWIDKSRVEQNFIKEISSIIVCPALNLELISQFINNLPEKINILDYKTDFYYKIENPDFDAIFGDTLSEPPNTEGSDLDLQPESESEDRLIFCPACGNYFNEKCDCGFDFDETIYCPLKFNESCAKTKEPCFSRSNEYESCPIFRSK